MERDDHVVVLDRDGNVLPGDVGPLAAAMHERAVAIEELRRGSSAAEWSRLKRRTIGQALSLSRKRATIVHVPARRELNPRPRERRATSRARARSPGRSDPDEPDDLEVSPAFRRDVSRALGETVT